MFQSYNGVYIKQEPREESGTSSSNHMFDAQSHYTSPNHENSFEGKGSATEAANGIPESSLSAGCSKSTCNELTQEEEFNETRNKEAREIKMEKNETRSKLGLPKKRKKVGKITDCFKQTKKVDRFNGMPEEDVLHRKLPDHLAENLDIVIIGFNPGLCAAYRGHHYAGPGNHFWKCLFLSGLIPQPMTAMDDYKLIEHGIGFTNIVERTTRSSADLSKKELKEGAAVLVKKLQTISPKIAVFNGKGIYEIFCGKKNFKLGMQPECIENSNIRIFVMKCYLINMQKKA
ncbi:G/T mismatch-specific thymine DNA glycosylase-like [Limulus polyphemus]|uniref:G/T mismatch-specific thymine DNA glycosylase-like n=1 Tax=Limulus polyphemus TaxID=6850 RepID=A0ABM1SP94_LIMPO|nr:G/T mismatch-specific thymine DNA glycosylase-like [Limulus polyphemus]